MVTIAYRNIYYYKKKIICCNDKNAKNKNVREKNERDRTIKWMSERMKEKENSVRGGSRKRSRGPRAISRRENIFDICLRDVSVRDRKPEIAKI